MGQDNKEKSFYQNITEELKREIINEYGGLSIISTMLRQWPKVLALFSGIVVIAVLGVFVGKFLLFGTEPDIIIKDGTITISGRRTPKTMVFPLSATQLWADTGIEVVEGQRLTFQVSGAINTAIHRVVNAGKYDVRPPQPWLSHPGESHGSRRHDTYRLRARLHPEAPYGSLLGLVCCPGTTCPVKPDTENLKNIQRQRHSPIRGMRVLIDSSDIGKPGELVSQCRGRLYLTVNENVPLEQDMYVGTLDENAEDLVERITKADRGEVPLAKLYDEVVLEWLVDAIEWAGPNDRSKTYNCSDDKPSMDKDKIEKYCSADPGCLITEKDAVCCARSKCCNYYEKLKLRGRKTAIELASLLLPVYPKYIDVDGGLSTDSDTIPVINNSFKTPNTEEIQCLAALRRVSDVCRWNKHISNYPQVWYDENAGFFWVTIQFD